MPRGTTQSQLYRAQTLYYSAVHPDTDEVMHPAGRMGAQVPCGMVITGILLALYKYALSVTHTLVIVGVRLVCVHCRTTPQVLFAQFINQTFNAFVNYTNRNAKSQTTNE